MLSTMLENLAGQCEIRTCFTTTACILTCIFLWAHWPRITRFLKFRKLPPGPWGLPFIGYLPFLKSQTAFLQLKEDVNKYGNIFGFQVGCRYLVVLDSFSAVKECFNREDFFGRPGTLFEMAPNQQSILGIEPPEWREHKKFFMNTLRLLGIGSKDYQVAVMGQVQDVVSALKNQQGKDVHILNEIDLAVNNSTYHLLYGKRYERNHPMIRLQRDFALAILSKFQVNGMKTFFPILGYLASLTPGFRWSMKVMEKMDMFVREEIKEHRQSLNPEEPLDYVDHFLLQMEKSESRENFDALNLLGNVKGVLVGASDTTRLSLSWFLLQMAAFPEVQAEVQDEIDSVLGREREPNYSDRVNMPKTEAAILESMRYKNILHFNIFRTALVDTTLCGFDIPKDTIILHPMTSQFRNPEYWHNPEKFEPSRFLSKDGSKVQVPEHFVLFSYGKRNCPGEKVAMTNLFLFGVTFLQRFRILPPEGGINLDIEVVFNNRPAHPYARFEWRE